MSVSLSFTAFAICKSCGHINVFEKGPVTFSKPSLDASLEIRYQQKCEVCGGDAEMLPGTWDRAKGNDLYLTAFDLDLEQWIEILKIIDSQKRVKLSPTGIRKIDALIERRTKRKGVFKRLAGWLGNNVTLAPIDVPRLVWAIVVLTAVTTGQVSELLRLVPDLSGQRQEVLEALEKRVEALEFHKQPALEKPPTTPGTPAQIQQQPSQEKRTNSDQ